ncbi:MAG: HNH endonuclease [Rectinema subterraneum]
MPSLYLSRLSESERNELIHRLHEIQKGKCFICEEEIDLLLHKGNIDIDHIIPLAMNGSDNPSNFALTHSSCNRSKQASDLNVARILARFEKLKKELQQENRSPTLADVLVKNQGSKFELSIRRESNKVLYSFPELGDNTLYAQEIYKDETSGFEYFFMLVPIEYALHDEKINPRPIGSNVSKLIQEFYQKRPQLHIQLGYIMLKEGPQKVRIFDGQHKAAAQVMLGARKLPVRVFIDPDFDILLTTNTNAGTTLKQIAFDKSIQRHLGNTLYEDRIAQYRKHCNLPEDSYNFSEKDLVQFFKGESREVKRYILDAVRDSITHDPENKLRDFMDFGGRGREKPFSYSTIEKTFYSFFIYQEVLETPLDYKMAENENPRELEKEQIRDLMNIIAEEIYIGKFDPDLGTSQVESKLQKGENIPLEHLAAYRMAKEEICYNWLKYIQQIIKNYFIMRGDPINEARLFQYKFPETLWVKIRSFVKNLYNMPVWRNKELSAIVFGGKQNYDYWQTIFETGNSPQGVKVLLEKINLMEMIRE